MTEELLDVRLLEKQDDTSNFCSGEDKLDDFLWNYAWSAQQSGGPRTYVAVTKTGEIIGYYSLVNNAIERKDAPVRLTAGMGAYPVPTILLARLAVDERHQGKGFGADLLLHALVIAVRSAELVGARAVEVDALREEVKTFYARYGFAVLDPQDAPLRMYLLMKDVRKALRSQGFI